MVSSLALSPLSACLMKPSTLMTSVSETYKVANIYLLIRFELWVHDTSDPNVHQNDRRGHHDVFVMATARDSRDNPERKYD